MNESTVESSTGVSVGLTEKRPIRVLHVDDDPGFLKVAKQCLEMQGRLQVDTARSEGAMEKMKQEAYDVIVADYQMLGKNGLEFLKELREKGNDTPFIIFTGKGREEVAIKALNLGADGYFSKHGEPETVYGELAHGIRQAVERKKADMKIWEREERLRAVFGSSPDAITVSDLHGNILDCNEAAWKMLGFSSKEEVIGKSSFDFIAKKDRQKALENLKKTLEQGTVRNLEYTLLNKDGGELWGELSTSIIKDSLGNSLGFVGIMRDITARKKAEEALRKSEEKFRNLFDRANDAIMYLDSYERILDVNGRAVEMFGGTREELIGKHFAKIGIFSIKEIPMLMRNFADVLAGKKVNLNVSIKNKKGQEISLDCSASLVKTGEFAGMIVIARDVSESKKVEEEKGKLLHELRGRAKELACLCDISKLVEKPDVTLEEIVKETVNLLPPAWQYPDIACARIVIENQEFTTENFTETRWKQQADIKVLTRKAGFVEVCYLEKRPTSAEGPFLKEERDLIDAIAERLGRITERMKTQNDLGSSQERLRVLFEYAPDAYYLNDLKGHFIDGNKAAEEVTGYMKNELIGKSFLKLKLLPRSQTLKAAKLLAMNALGKSTGPDEIVLNRKDGTQVPVEIRTHPVKLKGKTLVLGIARDISERKRMEEKLRVVGGLTRHDVRNKLSAVTGNAYLLKRKLSGDAKALEQLNDMEVAVRQIEQIFEFARTYEKLGVEQLTSIDARKAFDEATSLFSDLKDVKVVNECRGLTVLADSLLRQLFYNLIDNSLKYGEKIQQIRVYYKTSSLDQLELVYEDNGVGIPRNMRDNLFKEGVGKGTGYGLFMIKRICEVYGWNIQETGIQGKGVKFVITIPKTNPSGKENYLLQRER
jgi:PAS domain S-box-containing protein